MAFEVYHRNAVPSTTKSTRDVVLDASVTSPLARITFGAYSMQEAIQTASSIGSTGKKRRPSKLKTGRSFARSVSTPQMRRQVMSESDADKKRNKLGYQRISIACAHCRRRKIRCLVADGDPRSRCQNCIRLKKECVFYPVEQQSAIENKSQSSKAGDDTGESSTVRSSPHQLGAGTLLSERREGNGPPTLPSNAPSSFPDLPQDPGSAISSQGSFPPPDYSYSQPSDTPWVSQNGFAPHSSPIHPEQLHHLNQNFPRYNHVVSPGDVAPFYLETMQSRPDAHVAHHYQHVQQGADPYWQNPQHATPPVRSMSYDQARILHSNDPYAVGYHPEPSQHYSQMRPVPLSIDMQGPGVTTGTGGPHSAPLQYHHAYADQSRAYMLPPEFQGMQNASVRPEYPPQWYTSQPQFAPVIETPPESTYTSQPQQPD